MGKGASIGASTGGHFEVLTEGVRLKQQENQTDAIKRQMEREERERTYRAALAVREARIVAGEGTPPQEVHGWWGREGEDRAAEFLAFARSKDFRGSTTLRWMDRTLPVASSTEAAVDADSGRHIGRRLLAHLRGDRSMVVEAEVSDQEPIITRRIRAYPVGLAHAGIAYLCEDNTVRQVANNGQSNPEPLAIMGTDMPYEKYAGQAEEPWYDRHTYQPLLVQLDNLAAEHLVD